MTEAARNPAGAAENPADHEEKRVDLVFEGGGVRGIALVGALSVLEERGYQYQNLAGTSAGAIIATLVAAGYRAAEIRTAIAGQDFASFMDPTWEEGIPLIDRLPSIPFLRHAPSIGQALSVLLEEGIYRGDAFLKRMTELLEAKNKRTFADLVWDPDTTDLRYRYKVQVIASDLTGRCLLALPKDSAKLGIDNPDELSIAQAVRMSMSIPIFFKPVRFPDGKDASVTHVIVDGGVLSNFPVWLFDSSGVPDWPTFGVKLVDGASPRESLAAALPPNPVTNLVSYAQSLVSTMLEAHDRLYLEQDQFVRTITIPLTGVASTNFNLTEKDEEYLFDAGRTAAQSFLQAWDDAGGFYAYRAAYREGAPKPRRERALDLMRAAR